MIFNYIKIALRHLIKNKVYALVSIIGLGLGLACCILISLYIIDELGYDKQHVNAKQIYRLQAKLDMGSEVNAAVSNRAAGPTLVDEYPEVENYTRLMSAGATVEFTYENKLFQEPNVWFADSTIFDVFTYPLIAGRKSNLLKTPNTVVITRALAEKLFNSIEGAVGQQIRLNNSYAEVEAVMEDVPLNSEFNISALLSSTSLPEQTRAAFDQDWFRISAYTFLKFESQVDPIAFQPKLDSLSEKYVKPWAEANGVVASIQYSITPLKELHFTNTFEYDLPKGNKTYIVILSLLAAFILIVAVINFVNLSLAQSSKRAKEVGIRKTLGANRVQIALQFLGEALVITCLAVLLGLALVELLLASFNEISNKSFASEAIFDSQVLFVLGSLVILVGLLSGSYPAFVMSSFRPVSVLRGNVPKIGGVGSLRKGLMLVQFVFSLFMITGTLLIGNQMDYMQGMNLGFDRENVMTITLPADTSATRLLTPMLDSYQNDTRVAAISKTSMPTGQTGELMFRIESEESQMIERTVRTIFVDEYFVEVLGIEILKGRNFSRDFPTDQTQAFIINANAAKAFGWEEQALDKRLQWGLLPNGQASNDGKVVGVVNDFNFLSLHNPLEPLIICFNPNGTNQVSMKLSKGDYTHTIAEIGDKWEKITSKHPFNFTFLDQTLASNYTAERNMYEIFKYFAFISIVIALLGLFALISFSVQVKTKEIGIRKILGASSASIAWSLVSEFVLILVMAFVIATPLNIYLMSRWLEQFAYKVSISAVSPGLSLLIAFVLSTLVVFYHTYRINRTDPALALRYE